MDQRENDLPQGPSASCDRAARDANSKAGASCSRLMRQPTPIGSVTITRS